MAAKPKTQLTMPMIEAIVASMEQTASPAFAARELGIPRRTLTNWLTKGRADDADPESLVAILAARVEHAEAEWVRRQVERIEQAAKEPRTWQAAAWLLERRFPNEWARTDRQKIELTGAAGGVLNLGVDLPTAAGDAAVDFVKRLGVVHGGASGVG